MIPANFNCSQADLIVVIQTSLNSFLQYLPDFTLFSKVYSKEWCDTFKADLAAAAALPDEDTRRSESEAIRVILVKDNRLARFAWQALKRHISRAFDSDLVPLKLKSAGANYYSDAGNDGWPEAQQMFTNALNFMTANKDVLGTVMPDSFIASFTESVNKFKDTLAAYEQSKEAVSEGTQTRIKALNELHGRLMPMMLDGQEIFRDNEAVRKQFVFTDVLARVSGPGLAGMRGTVTDITTNAAIVNAVITVNDSTDKSIGTATSDAEGKFVINTPSGTFTVTVVANGYIARSVDGFTVDVGTVSKLDVSLSPMVVEE